jgi:hypothetical protein
MVPSRCGAGIFFEKSTEKGAFLPWITGCVFLSSVVQYDPVNAAQGQKQARKKRKSNSLYPLSKMPAGQGKSSAMLCA